MKAVEVQELSFAYNKNTPVLQQISFSLEQGRHMCLLGPNGAGKSTLFKCMLGLGSKYTGRILIQGEDIKKLSHRQLARKIAYIPQSSVHAFNYSVEDVVLMGTTALTQAMSSPGQKERQLSEAALERLGIGHLKKRKYQNISGGERQLVLIARALAQQAGILFMDEPTANLDYGNQCRVLEEIRRLSKQGYTIVQSTHNPEHALLYADTVLAICRGSVAAFGPANQVMDEALMEKLYGVETSFVEHMGRKLCIPKQLLINNNICS